MKIVLAGRYQVAVGFIQGILGYEWFTGGLEKTGPTYISGMAGTISAFASKNPNGWVKSFLLGTVLPNATAFGYLVLLGEILAGLALMATGILLLIQATHAIQTTVMAVTAIATFGTMIMSYAYWEAAGWLSPSTAGINFVMGLAELGLFALAVYALASPSSPQLLMGRQAAVLPQKQESTNSNPALRL